MTTTYTPIGSAALGVPAPGRPAPMSVVAASVTPKPAFQPVGLVAGTSQPLSSTATRHDVTDLGTRSMVEAPPRGPLP